MELNKM